MILKMDEKNMILKFMNKQVFFVLIFNVLSYTVTAQSTVTEKEKEVKTSGKYLWSYATAAEEKTAKEMAVTLLFESEDFKNQIKSTPNLNKTAVSYIVRSRGNQLMAIAYLDKNDTSVVEGNYAKKNETKKKETKKKETKKNTLKDTINSTKNNTTAEVSVNSDLNLSKTIDAVIKKTTSTSSFINSVLGINDVNVLEKELYNFKSNGKISYSTKVTAYENISNCYIFLFDKDTSKITHILDKGTETRVNFLDSQKINLKENQSINGLQKIYVYEF
jgi:hypothetical protein